MDEEEATVAPLNSDNPAAAPAPAATTTADSDDDDTADKEDDDRMRLSENFIKYILSWKPEVMDETPDEYYARMINNPDLSPEYVERRTQTLRDIDEQFKLCDEMMVEYQAWMRAEYDAKGYVEVDGDYWAERVRLAKELEEDDEYPEAFGPMEGLVTDETPQSVIDELYAAAASSRSQSQIIDAL